ncbi:MAG: DNA primase [Desulfobacterales bacterium]
MAFRVPEEIVSEIKQSVDIVDIVSEVVRLKNAGRNHVGLCPFHSEKTPSFTVNREKQIFHCFGCGEGGDVFGFVMKVDNLSYPEAIRLLADRCNIRIPGNAADRDGHGKSDRELLFELHQAAAAFYRDCLNPNTGATALAYLNRRGIDSKTSEAFGLGYAPAGWHHIEPFLKRKFPPKLVELSGLVIPRKGSPGTYDRFRNRIIFPIFDSHARIIGFGGRAVDDSLPKYLNSPETLTYNKRNSLYGIHLAKMQCRKTDTVHIVEGYFDCISLYQYGLTNTVATLGTALTVEQIRMLRGFAEKMVLIYDSDEAGIKAAVRSVGSFMKQNVNARILVLPKGHDPDSCIRALGPKVFEKMTSEARNIVPFLIDVAVKRNGMSPEGRIRTVGDMMQPLAEIQDPVARSLYVKELSERIMIDEAAILQKLKNFQAARETGTPVMHIEKDGADAKKNRIERRIIEMMLQFPESVDEIRAQQILEKFENGLLKSIGMIILECVDAGNEPIVDIFQRLDDEKKRIVSEMSIQEDAWDRNGCLRLIRQFKHMVRKGMNQMLIHRIKAAESDNDQELLFKLLTEKQNASGRYKKAASGSDNKC